MWVISSFLITVLSGNLRRAISDKNRRVLQTGSLQSTARIQLLTVYGEGRTDEQIMQECECCVRSCAPMAYCSTVIPLCLCWFVLCALPVVGIEFMKTNIVYFAWVEYACVCLCVHQHPSDKCTFTRGLCVCVCVWTVRSCQSGDIRVLIWVLALPLTRYGWDHRPQGNFSFVSLSPPLSFFHSFIHSFRQ